MTILGAEVGDRANGRSGRQLYGIRCTGSRAAGHHTGKSKARVQHEKVAASNVSERDCINVRYDRSAVCQGAAVGQIDPPVVGAYDPSPIDDGPAAINDDAIV